MVLPDIFVRFGLVFTSGDPGLCRIFILRQNASEAMEVTAALSRLVDAYLQHGPDAAVLPAVRKACDALQVVPADRSYRYAFTENYVLLLREAMTEL